MGGSEALKSRGKTKILFLLRAYNDIDHISPIIWKSATAGCHVFFVFVGRDYSDDYRIKFVAAQGARQIRSGVIEWYHGRLRHFLTFRLLLVKHTLLPIYANLTSILGPQVELSINSYI